MHSTTSAPATRRCHTAEVSAQRIKIDREFVHGVADNPNDRSLVRTIVAMGRRSASTWCRGRRERPSATGCSATSVAPSAGYLISHPVPPMPCAAPLPRSSASVSSPVFARRHRVTRLASNNGPAAVTRGSFACAQAVTRPSQRWVKSWTLLSSNIGGQAGGCHPNTAHPQRGARRPQRLRQDHTC